MESSGKNKTSNFSSPESTFRHQEADAFIELTTDCIPAVTAGEQLEFRLSMAGFSSGQNAETAYSTTTTYAGGSTTEGGTVIPGSVDFKTFVQ